MSLETQTSKVVFQGNASTTVFSYSFIIPDASYVVATYTDTAGAQTTLSTSQYTITGLDDPNGGTITYPLSGSPMATGASLTLQRIVPYTQPTVLTNQSNYYPDVVEEADDFIVMQTQQLAEQMGRTIMFNVADEDVEQELPVAALRVGKFLSFDTDGNPIVSSGTGADAGLRADLAASSGSSLVGFIQSGTGAVAQTVQNKLRLYKSITDYGADTGNSAAVNRPLIQAAIDANYGKCLLIPAGTFEVSTAGSTTAPVGDALTITDEITLIFEGIIKGTNNCNIIRVAAGSQDVVTFMYEGGGIEGMSRVWSSVYSTANYNGANVKVDSGIFRPYQIKIINPVQYGILADSVEDGEICECDFVGGWATYDATATTGPNDNNYCILLNDASHGWKIDGNKTRAGGSGEKCSQASASETIGASGTTPSNRVQVINNRFFAQWEKGAYIHGNDLQISNNWVYDCDYGEGLRTVGKRNLFTGNIIRSCASGGIYAADGEGALIEGNQISDCEGVGILLKYYNATAPTTQSIDNAKIIGNKIDAKTTGTSILEGIGVRGINGTATVETGIEVCGNTVINANYSGAEDRAAIYFLPDNSSTQFNFLRCDNNTVSNCGSYGIRFATGVYQNNSVNNNFVANPGINHTALGGLRAAYKWGAVTWVGGTVTENQAVGTSAEMSYGFDGVSSVESILLSDNRAVGYATAGYNGFTHSTVSKKGNRQGTGTITGTFTATAAASTVISNTNQQTGMRVSLFPTNAAAATLQAGANALYFAGTFDATTFTLVTTGGGAAAGTETFAYEISV